MPIANMRLRFNPRVLAGGRDRPYSPELGQLAVSIHASSREDATQLRAALPGIIRVSIHASSREDATPLICRMDRRMMFQSTRPRGRTRQCAGIDFCRSLVSIHASSREDATRIDLVGGDLR